MHNDTESEDTCYLSSYFTFRFRILACQFLWNNLVYQILRIDILLDYLLHGKY